MNFPGVPNSVVEHREWMASNQPLNGSGAQPVGWISLACELQGTARVETVPETVDIVLTSRLLANA